MKKRAIKLLVGIPAAALLIFVLFVLPRERKHYTCLRCRLYKRVQTACGIEFATYEQNACSEWYAGTHPDHQHEWRKSSCTYGSFGLLGLPGPYTCGSGHPAFSVPPEAQREFLVRASPDDAEAYFTLLESVRRNDHDKACDMVRATLKQAQSEDK